MKAKLFLIFILLIISISTQAQFKNNVWCFGDSAGIKFNQGTTQLFNSSTVTTGGSCSISDSSGNLLFYANTDYYFLWTQGSNRLGVVWDRFHNLMQNGDTLIGGLTFQEQVIVPWPDSSNLFYIFNVGVFVPYGFWYSVVDMNQNGGLGAVVQKNVQLTNYEASDCVTAVKHGNGRDWWVFFRRFDIVSDAFYKYLISPTGISGPFIQNIGTPTDNGFMHTTFSKDGSKHLAVDYRGLIEVYDFDRCTGLFSNVITIEPEQSTPHPGFFGCEFSANGRFIYVSSNNNTESTILQFDLQSPNIAASKDTIVYLTIPSTGGLLKRAPDDKIYFSCVYNDGVNTYPYIDSLNNSFNQNLSVINYPDSAGLTCGYSPFSFYLGGNETYWGLPNNPDYDLPTLVGSPCDTLVGISETSSTNLTAQLNIYYHPVWQTAFINASNLKGTKGTMKIFDMQGKLIYKEDIHIQNGYYTRDFNMTGMTDGMYFVNIISSGQKISGKLVKY